MPHIYTELRRIAHLKKLGERNGHTLSTEGLVHEAYLKIIDQKSASWRDERHFVALASRAIRQVLIDYARSRNRKKRQGTSVHLELSKVQIANSELPDYLVSLEEAMQALSDYDMNLASLVEVRFFGGASMSESAAILGLSQRSAERNWTRAKAFLIAHIARQ